MRYFIVLLLLVLVIPVPGMALEKEAVERTIQTPVRSLSPSAIEGLYEVVTQDNRIVYMDKTGRYLVVGSILDIQNRANLTDQRMEEITVVNFEDIPLSEAIREGEGIVKVVVFDDPDCPFCRKMHKELKELTDVSLYYFVFNLPGHPEAYNKSVKIVCAPDPVEALNRAMEGDSLEDLKSCQTEQIERNKSLSLRLGVQATPYLIFESGKAVRGYRKASELQKHVNEILGLPLGTVDTEPEDENVEEAPAASPEVSSQGRSEPGTEATDEAVRERSAEPASESGVEGPH